MKRRTFLLLVLGGLVLGACAPVTTAPQTSALDPYGGGLKPLGTPPALWFMAGSKDVFSLTVTVSGNNLRANAPDWCAASGANIVCTVPTLPAGKNFVLPMKGSNLSAVAVYKRFDGVTYNSVVKQ